MMFSSFVLDLWSVCLLITVVQWSGAPVWTADKSLEIHLSLLNN